MNPPALAQLSERLSEAPSSGSESIPEEDSPGAGNDEDGSAALEEASVPSAPLRDAIACPSDLGELTPRLIRDIPTYANRVLQRSLGEVPAVTAVPPLSQYRPSYVLMAGQVEEASLDLSDRVYTTAVEAEEELEQLFFTTLERTYNETALTEIFHYHWLFLVPVEDGWQLAFMFSAIDTPGSDRPILPPKESSNGSVGRGIQLWLRDCRAGAIEQ